MVKAFKPTSKYSGKNNTPIQEKSEYSQTLMEFVSLKKNQIVISYDFTYGANGTATIYTIPKGFDLYITNISISAGINGGGAGGNASRILVNINGTNNILCSCDFNQSSNTSTTSNINLSMPLKIKSGTNIQFYKSTTIMQSCAIIYGWLEPLSQ